MPLITCDMGDSDNVSWFPVDCVDLEYAERKFDEGKEYVIALEDTDALWACGRQNWKG